MEFQVKHIETNPMDLIRSMTTVIAIRCKEGIVIASDNQGTTQCIKKTVKKIYQINNNSIGIGCSGDQIQIKELIEKFEEGMQDDALVSKKTLKSNIENILTLLNREKNIYTSIHYGHLNPCLYFSPEALLGAKLSDGSFYIYHMDSEK